MSQVAHHPGAYSSFYSMKQLGVFLLPLDGMLVHHRRVTPSIKFASTQLYTWLERGAVRVKCLAQEHCTMSPARVETLTDQSILWDLLLWNKDVFGFVLKHDLL